MKYTCQNCNDTFNGVSRDEDGRPEIDNVGCADPTCEVFLCDSGCRELSFACDGCGQRFCNEHRVAFGKLLVCAACVAEAAEANGIECEMPEVA